MSFGRDGETEPYIVRVRPNWEEDEDLKNLLANEIDKKKINTLCLTERLLLGDFLYWKYKKCLDVNTVTLCSSSRCSDGGVPCVSWCEDCGGVHAFWRRAAYRYDFLRSRQAVS